MGFYIFCHLGLVTQLIPYLLGEEGGIYIFLCLTHIFTTYLRNIHEKKNLGPENTHEKKFWTYEIPKRKNLDPQNTHEKKLWTHEISTRENFGPTKYPRNTHKKKSWTHEIATRKNLDPRNTHEKKFWFHEISTRKNFGPTKCPREKILDPRNIYEKKFWTHKISTRKKKLYPLEHNDTTARDPRNSAHSFTDSTIFFANSIVHHSIL